MIKPKEKLTLSKPLYTERFELIPMSRWEAIRAIQRVDADPELRALLYHRKRPLSLLALLKFRGSKIPKRVMHKIVDRATGHAIGFHVVKKLKYNSATMEVVIYDRAWWGCGTVVEVRKAALIAFKEATGVQQFCSTVHSRNFASILNYKKLGFEKSGVNYSCAFDENRNEAADYFNFSLRAEQLEKSILAWKADGALKSS